MMASILCFLTLMSFAINYILEKKKKKRKIFNKNILVIGGSSGLGSSIAYSLVRKSNNVTATSRNYSFINEMNNSTYIRFIHCDVFDEATFEKHTTDYDIIFYCTGLAIPKDFIDTTVKDHELCFETNYMGMIKILKHYSNVNKKPFDFVIIGSTLSTFPLQGYTTYAPTKNALLSFFYTSYDEFLKKSIRLHFFSPANMSTRGFFIENTTKPNFTKAVESLQTVYDPDVCAEYFIDNFTVRKVITMDWFSYFCQIRTNCEKPIDYLLFPFAVVYVSVTKVLCYAAFKLFGG